jgi:histidinol-phosphate aminotransferase
MGLDLLEMARVARAERARIVWVCDPNNPTGSVVGADEWRAFLDALPEDCLAVVDEAYVEYVEAERRIRRERDVEEGRPVVLLRTFSKLFGLAGMRLGYAIGDPELARELDLVHEPFNVNRPALAAGVACLRAPQIIEQRHARAAAARALLSEGLIAAGVDPLPSQANFVLARVGGDDVALTRALAEREGLLLRPGRGFGLDGHVRITLGPQPLMERVARAIGDRVAV